MHRKGILFSVFLMTLCIAAASPVQAQWRAPATPVIVAAGEQSDPHICRDGSDGVIIVWHGRPTPGDYYDIHAQRLDWFGRPLWDVGGVRLCTSVSWPDYRQYPRLIADGAGGAIAAWVELGMFIFSQRIDSNGMTIWADSGIALSESGIVSAPSIASDGAGGAIVAWPELYSVADLFAQRVSADGEILWGGDGTGVCELTGREASSVQMVPDGAGGAIIAWQALDYDMVTKEVSVQRMNASGDTLWGGGGVAVQNSIADYSIVGDGAGGCFVAWVSNAEIWVQRIDGSGAPAWTAPVNATYSAYEVTIASDGAGGVIVAWRGQYEPYAQRFDASGNALWTAGGIAVGTASILGKPQIVNDGAGGATIVSYDFEAVHGQIVGADGTVVVPGAGSVLSSGSSYHPVAVPDGTGSVIAVFETNQAGTGYDILAHRIGPTGKLGCPAPVLLSVSDTPDDEGGWIRLHTTQSYYDQEGIADYPVTGYNLWRKITAPLALAESSAALPAEEVIRRAARDDLAPGTRIDRAAAAALGFPPGEWESAGFHAAIGIDFYDFLVPTKSDSTAGGIPWETYLVTAHTTTPLFYFISDPDSGYSVDNLAPAPPAGLAGEQSYSPAGIVLIWAANAEADIACYEVFRGTSADFVMNEASRIASPVEPGCFDGDWSWSGGYYYKVTAVDRHGNESPAALLAPDGVTGSETPVAPGATYLSQNFPNPFNPVTKIEFGLASAGAVRLRIYDASGRLIRTLTDEAMPAGRYSRTWDGRDARGSAVASGIYFYRLEAGAYTQTRKMALLR